MHVVVSRIQQSLHPRTLVLLLPASKLELILMLALINAGKCWKTSANCYIKGFLGLIYFKSIQSIQFIFFMCIPDVSPIPALVAELFRPLCQDVVRQWFEARQGTSRKVFILGYSCTQRFPRRKCLLLVTYISHSTAS